MHIFIQKIRSNYKMLSTIFIITLLLFGWKDIIASYYPQYTGFQFLDRANFDKNVSLSVVNKLYDVNNPLQLLNRTITNGMTLVQKVRILCMVLTMHSNHEKLAIHVRNTWGKRCNKLIFMSSINDETLPSIDLGFKESMKVLWAKTRKGFKYVYDHHLEDYDWFMKADDNTYVIVENLRYMLSAYDPLEEAIYFGNHFINRHWKNYNKKGYMGGGAGYVLSRKSLKLLIEKGFSNTSICHKRDTAAEDIEMGFCLENLGVKFGDARDSLKREKFFQYSAADILVNSNHPKNYWYYPIATGTSECCSDLAISFHEVSSTDMYVYDYLIYRLHPYGIIHDDPQRPPYLPENDTTVLRTKRV